MFVAVAMPRIAEEWRRVHGAAPTEADISRVYDVFVPKNIAVASRYADLVPGAASVAEALRRRGLKIGTTTGYTREIMAEITPVNDLLAAQQVRANCSSHICAGLRSRTDFATFYGDAVNAPINVPLKGTCCCAAAGVASVAVRTSAAIGK